MAARHNNFAQTEKGKTAGWCGCGGMMLTGAGRSPEAKRKVLKTDAMGSLPSDCRGKRQSKEVVSAEADVMSWSPWLLASWLSRFRMRWLDIVLPNCRR